MLRQARHDKKPLARDYALRLLGIRPRSVREMRDRLGRKGYDRAETEAAIAELCQAGLLDDRKFAAQWVKSRLALKPMGFSRLRAELLAKGVDREIIEASLSQYRSELDEKATALALTEKKIHAWRGLKPEAAQRRLAGFLERRGFDLSTVAVVLKKVCRMGS